MTNSPIAAESAPGFLTVAPQFTVPDVVAAASYYCDILGFENRGFFGDPPVFAMLGRGEVELFFNQSPDAASHVRPRAAVGYDAYIHNARTSRDTSRTGLEPAEGTAAGKRSIASGRLKVLQQGRRSEGEDADTRTHSTLSAESTRVRVFYPFHPLCNSCLQVIRRPKRGDGAVSVVDRRGKRLKVPSWMLLPDAAGIRISVLAELSSEALLSLTSLLAPLLDTESRTDDNLLKKGFDPDRGGHRAAITTSGSDRNGGDARTHRRKRSSRTGRSHGPRSDGGFSNKRRRR